MIAPPSTLRRQPSVDPLLIIAVAGLMCFGVAFIYSAVTANESTGSLPWYRQDYIKQLIWYSTGLSAAAMINLLDYRSVARWALVAYWGSIILLLLVLIPGIGTKVLGARRWIDFGVFRLQPSEFAKLSVIFVLAHFLSRPADELRLPGNFFKPLGMTALPFFLIMKEPDLGSALVLVPVVVVMLYVAGTPTRYLNRLIVGVGLCASLLVMDILFAPKNWRVPLQEYQRQRLMVFFGRDFAAPDATPEERREKRALQRDKSYNVEQALISVGSGGLLGKGWCQGTQNVLGFLPRAVAHNDFIFSVIAEEKGFVGSVFVLTLYAVILFIGIRIAGEARDRLGKLLAVGVVVLLFGHVFINIGMNIRIMPVTGVPLPLLSYGGSSVICSLIAIGVLQNVYLYRKSY
jgi:rod shape determining protein RodA